MNTRQTKPQGLRDAWSRATSDRRRGTATALRFETLEPRRVPSSFGGQGADEPTFDSPNQTYDQAVDLGDIRAAPVVTMHGALGAGEAGAGDVEWYRFVLDRPARVTLRLGGSQLDTSFRGVLSLFNQDFDFVDFTNPQGLRRLDLAVADDGDGVAAIDRVIGPGTYNLAVSGAGNEIFSPLVAHTGLPGSTGEFDLSVSAVDAGPAPSDGPWVLGSTPAPDAVLTSSPLLIRVELSRSLDPVTIASGRTVQLDFSPDGRFSGVGTKAVPLAAVNFSSSACELQLVPASPLAPGYYKVVLTGKGDPGSSSLAGIDGSLFGSDELHPIGRDHVLMFQVGGVEGSTNLTGPADDTPAGAHELGDLTLSVPVRVEATIGDDPFYNPANAPDPLDPAGLFRPGNDVDLYHFRVQGPSRYAFFADVFAGRIGSPLAPGLRLFRFNVETQQLELQDVTTFIYNIIPFEDRGVLPQLSDASLAGELEAGDYYLVVSSGYPWSYDPSVSRSNHDGLDPGPYVLNLFLSPTPADASPYSRMPVIPPYEPDPTDGNGDDDGTPDSWMNEGKPPGHNAPPLPGRPGMGGGIWIRDPIRQESDAPPVIADRPSGGTSSTTPPAQDPRTPASSSSTDLSVLAFQPVGGVTRTEREPETEPGSTVSKLAAVTSAFTLSSQAMAARTTTPLDVAPALSPGLAIGNVAPRLEPRIANAADPAGRIGIVPQTLVPWAPEPDQFNSHRAVATLGFGAWVFEFNVPNVVRLPLPTIAERGVVLDRIVPEEAPLPAPVRGDEVETAPEDSEPGVTIPSTRSAPAPEDQAELARPSMLSWALLATTSLSSFAYVRYRGAFRPWWFSRSPLSGTVGQRPRLGEP